MHSNEVRERFLKFFAHESRGGHKIIPSSSLVPENDPSVLFTTAGMQQFKSYYTGDKDADHDFGTKNVVTVQKCVRTNDIDEVGDDTHLTFFEMLGNFSFGGYWKEEAIKYAHEFITKELGLQIDYVSVFKDKVSGIPADVESREIWKNLDSDLMIKDHGREDNFWGPTGEEGPCGPTTEIYINGVEIWNIVFNEFCKTRDGKFEPLSIKGIDTGMGLERLLVQIQKKSNVYETDLFNGQKTKEERIIGDHVKASLFIVSDGVVPSNTGAGYVLRRLFRTIARMVANFEEIIDQYINKYKKIYPNLNKEKWTIEFTREKEGYQASYGATGPALINWKKTVEPNTPLTGHVAFGISSTIGTRPADVVKIATELGVSPSPAFEEELEDATKKHKDLSRTSSVGMFKGGLANHDPKTIKLHTAHHLLLAALQNVLGKEVKQKGSNINEERLRIDFSYGEKMTEDQRREIEDWVNDKIKRGLKVLRREMPLAEAQKIGAEMEFGAKYGDTVTIYEIVDPSTSSGSAVVSREFCGGPHVGNTRELGQFKIQKEEAVAAGVRRIKATLV